MADYIGITEAQSNPFAPLTSELVKQLRDNPIAIAQGADGAPRINSLAHPVFAAGETLLDQLAVAETISLSSNSAGTVTGNIDLVRFTPMKDGELRLSGVPSGGEIRLFKNSSLVATLSGSGTQTADFSFLATDSIRVFLVFSATFPTDGGSASTTFTDVRFLADQTGVYKK